MPARRLVACHVCRGNNTRVVASIVSDIDGHDYDAIRCESCRLLFAYPVPELSFEALQSVYGPDYTREQREPDEDPLALETLRGATNRQMEFVERHVTVGRALNIGAMSGASSVLQERGWSLHVIEVSTHAAETARRRWGYDITVSRVEDFRAQPASFDFIKMGHVIEHLGNPRQALQALARTLRPGGVLLVDTDNARGLRTDIEGRIRGILGEELAGMLVSRLTKKNLRGRYGRLIPPVHLHIFSEVSLSMLLHETGFEVVRVLKPAWGDPTWFPLTNVATLSLAERAFIGIDKVGARFGRGELLSILARRKAGRVP